MQMSIKPSKQRKAHFAAPLHRRRKMLSAPLSKELRFKYNRRAFPVRKGDTVKLSRGDFLGTEGKVTEVNLKKFKLSVEGIKREKADGRSVFVQVVPSKVVITKLNTDDKWRVQRLGTKPEVELEKEAEPTTETSEDIEEKPSEPQQELSQVEKNG